MPPWSLSSFFFYFFHISLRPFFDVCCCWVAQRTPKGELIDVDSPFKMPDADKRCGTQEPFVRLEMLTPQVFFDTAVAQTRRRVNSFQNIFLLSFEGVAKLKLNFPPLRQGSSFVLLVLCAFWTVGWYFYLFFLEQFSFRSTRCAFVSQTPRHHGHTRVGLILSLSFDSPGVLRISVALEALTALFVGSVVVKMLLRVKGCGELPQTVGSACFVVAVAAASIGGVVVIVLIFTIALSSQKYSLRLVTK